MAPAAEADAVVWVELVVPIEPSNAMTPKASAKIASAAAITRLRIREMRCARARSFSRASSFGERPKSGERPGSGERSGSREGGVVWGVRSDMAAKVGARCESGPGRPREVPGAASALVEDSGRSRAAPGRRADHSSRPGPRAVPPSPPKRGAAA